MANKCGICLSNINAAQSLVFCLFCETKFHLDHLQGWLDEEDICPNCRRELPKDYIEEINKNNPYLEHRKKLNGISETGILEGDFRESQQQDAMRKSFNQRTEEEKNITNWNFVRIFIIFIIVLAIIVS